MTITAIEKQQKNRYAVFADGELCAVLDPKAVLESGLQTGQEYSAAQLQSVVTQMERRQAREKAYDLLGYRDHSCRELYDKLRRYVRAEIAAETVAHLQELGYLNDEAYARKLAAYFLENRKWGARRACLELERRGIDRELARSAVASCEVDTAAQLRAVIERKYAARLRTGDYRERQKVTAALARLGFGFDDIKTAIREYAESGDDFPEEW